MPGLAALLVLSGAAPAGPAVRWAGELESRPEGLACLDVDRDGVDDAVVVDARGLLLLTGSEPTPLRIPWPDGAPAAPPVRDPHARVVPLPARVGGGLAIIPAARGGYGVLREAAASHGLPVLHWTLQGTAPLGSAGEHLLSGLRVAGTHQLMGLRLDDQPVRGLPSGVRAVALMRTAGHPTLALATPEGAALLAEPGETRRPLVSLPGVAPPLLALDDDGDGSDELYSAAETERGPDAVLVTRVREGRAVVERLVEVGGRVHGLAQCPGGPAASVLALVEAPGGWRVVSVRP